MTNREYMETLSNLDFSRFLFSEVLPAGKEYNDSILGIADWLGRDRYFDESDMSEVGEARCGRTNDSISRQMAINDIREYKVEPCHFCDESEIKGFNDGIDTAISALATLPSAEPEIIRCKDCEWCEEHYDTDGNAPYWICKNWDGGTDADGFCHEAERRT